VLNQNDHLHGYGWENRLYEMMTINEAQLRSVPLSIAGGCLTAWPSGKMEKSKATIGRGGGICGRRLSCCG
jgi:hypothetical protein